MSDVGPSTGVLLRAVRRGLALVPAAILLGALFAGFDGAISVGYGLLIVTVNFALSVTLLSGASKFSPTVVAVAALGGYVVRLALVFGAVMLVRDQSWTAPLPLGVTIISTHLRLLVWEVMYVSTALTRSGPEVEVEAGTGARATETFPEGCEALTVPARLCVDSQASEKRSLQRDPPNEAARLKSPPPDRR